MSVEMQLSYPQVLENAINIQRHIGEASQLSPNRKSAILFTDRLNQRVITGYSSYKNYVVKKLDSLVKEARFRSQTTLDKVMGLKSHIPLDGTSAYIKESIGGGFSDVTYLKSNGSYYILIPERFGYNLTAQTNLSFEHMYRIPENIFDSLV